MYIHKLEYLWTVIKKSKLHLSLALFAITFIIYIHNLSNSVYGGDSGDFISAALVHGVAHPSGYPLFTLMSILMLHLPIHASAAFKIGILSSFFTSASVVLLFQIAYKFTKQSAVSFIIALLFAFTTPFWLYAEMVEIFALNTFFILLLFLLSYQYNVTKKKKFLYFFSFILGLSFTNNEIIVLFLPMYVMLFANILWHAKKKLRLFLTGFLLFSIGLTPYIYIPIAAHFNPPINWDNADTIPNFVRLLLRKDYGWSYNTDLLNAKYFIGLLRLYKDYWDLHLGFLNETIFILGILYLFFKKRYNLLLSLLTGFIISGPLFLLYARYPVTDNFDVNIIERFFMVSGTIVFLFIPFGLEAILLQFKKFGFILEQKFKMKLFQQITSRFIVYIFLIIPISFYFKNVGLTDLHSIYIGDNFAYDIFSSVPRYATLLTTGDTNTFNLWYLQLASSARKDVKMHYASENNDSPDLLTSKKPELKKNNLSSGTKTNSQLVYGSVQDEDYIAMSQLGYTLIPYGLVFRIENPKQRKVPSESAYLQKQKQIWSTFHISALRQDKQIIAGSYAMSDIRQNYATALLNISEYLYTQYHDMKRTQRFFKLANDLNEGKKISINTDFN